MYLCTGSRASMTSTALVEKNRGDPRVQVSFCACAGIGNSKLQSRRKPRALYRRGIWVIRSSLQKTVIVLFAWPALRLPWPQAHRSPQWSLAVATAAPETLEEEASQMYTSASLDDACRDGCVYPCMCLCVCVCVSWLNTAPWCFARTMPLL